MTQDIIRMAREAGAAYSEGLIYFEQSDLQRFANLVAAHEREACAKVCEAQGEYGDEQYAAAIRARGTP